MDITENNISCTINLEWKNNQGTILRKVSHKLANLRMIRNESREMFLEVNSQKAASVKLELKGINVHKKFMSEGKASIIFQEAKCTLYLSNAPPGNLFNFLRTMFVKMTGDKSDSNKNIPLRNKLLSHKPIGYDEISPVTTADLIQTREQISRKTDTTPSPSSRKRKLHDRDHKGPAAKRLYSQSPIPTDSLNIDQQRVLEACSGGHNVFFTGSAGTGKSYLLKKIISVLPPDVTVATASTGVAACHIGGTTLHAFAGIGTGEGTLEKCYKLASKSSSAQLWRRTKHLIIDEISMIDGNFFTKLEAVARHIRNNEKPFGGIQLILSGDFLQLPPVSRKTKEKDIFFCFQSPAWNRCVKLSYELTQIHRQTDSEFINILNDIRVGRVTPEILTKLQNTSKQSIEHNGILATRLSSQNVDADIINQSKLKALNGDEKAFVAQDSDSMYTKQLDLQTPVPGKLILKVGAQVMLLKNISVSSGLVNGARGVVVKFQNDLPVVRFRNSKEYSAKQAKWHVRTNNGRVLTRLQVPLKLAWAFSIHKSQGLTLDCVEMSLARVFEAGQAYVALSRAQSLQTLRVLDFDKRQVWANPKVLTFYKQLKQKIEQTELVPLGKKNWKDKPLIAIC